MHKKTIGILATSVALCALCLATEASAFGRGGGGGGGGGGFRGGGGGFHMGGGGGGFHMGGGGFGGPALHAGGMGIRPGGFGGFAGRSMTPRGLGAPGFNGHSLGVRGLAGHELGGRGFAAGRGLSSHSLLDHPYNVHGGLGAHAFANRGLRGANGISGDSGRFAHYGAHNGLAAHNQLGVGGQLRGAPNGQFAHNQFAHGQFTPQHVHALNNFHMAHNEFATQHFHGLNNFNQRGFNRNAFGDKHGWNRWGGRFWGAGWNNWGGGWGGWAGPVFWPFLYGDIFSFALWPYSYYDPFWSFGAEFLLASIFAPGPYFGIDYGYAPGYYGYTYGSDYYGSEPYAYDSVPNVYYGTSEANTYAAAPNDVARQQQPANDIGANRQALAETNTEAVQSCGALAPGVTNLPIDKIRQAVRPSADQDAALDDLNAASTQANEIIKSSCPTEVPLTPVSRLDAAQQRVEAMIQAVETVRPPLERLYDSLSDEQRQQFEAIGRQQNEHGSAAPGGNLAGLCGQQSGGFATLPVQRLEQVVHPDAQQRSAFDDLTKAAGDAAAQLQSSCPAAVPQTPVGRLDAIEARLNSMVSAMKSIGPKLATFYASLTDEQKARFNTMGPPPSARASQ